MSSEIESYQAARAAFVVAEKKCQAIADTVKSAAMTLSNWREAMVSNASGGFPMEVALNPRTPSIDAQQWPSGQQIATALSEYHTMKSEMSNAYSSIPATQRDVVVPPPK